MAFCTWPSVGARGQKLGKSLIISQILAIWDQMLQKLWFILVAAEAVDQCSLFTHAQPALVISYLFVISHSDGWEVVSHLVLVCTSWMFSDVPAAE